MRNGKLWMCTNSRTPVASGVGKSVPKIETVHRREVRRAEHLARAGTPIGICRFFRTLFRIGRAFLYAFDAQNVLGDRFLPTFPMRANY